MKRALVLVGFALVLIATLGGVGFAWAIYAHATRSATNESIQFSVKRGATLRSVLDELAAEGALERPSWVYYYARYAKLTSIRTGEYEIVSGTTPAQLLAILGRGQVRTETFSIPEGYNRWQIREVLAAGKWLDEPTFDRLCEDQDFLARENIPGPTCEGYLFPETYTFARGVPPKQIFSTLFGQWRDTIESVRGELGAGPQDLDLRAFTTLASIVEKETGAAEERPRIACVFYNRLASKPVMKLQTDPTVIYAATLSDPEFDGNLRSYHLRQMQNPYNTYLNVGLPPGPIASPGRAAFEAVSKPAQCEDLFFVSMNNGKHVFCPTYECHTRNVQKWQIDYFRGKGAR